jgi:hypothetical protein
MNTIFVTQALSPFDNHLIQSVMKAKITNAMKLSTALIISVRYCVITFDTGLRQRISLVEESLDEIMLATKVRLTQQSLYKPVLFGWNDSKSFICRYEFNYNIVILSYVG